MGILIKCDPDPASGRYVYWSDVVEAPICHGTREYVAEYLRRFEHHCHGASEIAARFARADANGTSSMPGFYDWDTGSLIVEQRGLLPRERLWDFCAVYCLEDPARRDEWLDMLEPFDDCFEHDSPTGNTCPVLPCPDHVVRRS